LRTRPPLIDAITGAPGQAFPQVGSEVVSFAAGSQSLCTNRLLSEHLTETHVFITAFNEENITQKQATVNNANSDLSSHLKLRICKKLQNGSQSGGKVTKKD